MNLKKLFISLPMALASASLALAAPPAPSAPPPGSFAPAARLPGHGHGPQRRPLIDRPGMRGPVMQRIARVEEEGNAWIGVQLGPLPSALAAHLGLENRGLMVRNVFRGSPADRAGIQQYDVIVRAGDQEVTGTVAEFSRTVRDRKVGETLTLTLIRGGKEITQDIVLGEAPPPHELELKFTEEPDVLYRRDFGLRGRIFRPGPDGWIVEDLGELPDLQELLRERTDDLRRRFSDRPAPPASPDHARRVGKDGVTIDVRRQRDGSIEVRRERRSTTTGPAEAGVIQRSEVVVYPNMDELRKGDPEAAALLDEHAAQRPEEQAGPRRDRDERERRFERRRIVPTPDRLREWRERFFQGPFERPAPGAEPPPVRFEVQPDGKITVHKRTRDAELSMTYGDRDEFREKAPELFKQFERMEESIR